MPHIRRLGPSVLSVCFLVAMASVRSYGQAIYTATSAAAQENTAPPQPQPGTVTAPPGKLQDGPGQPIEDKRAFGVLPNYKTAEANAPFVPLTTKQKFTIASKDSFDYPVLFTTAFFAGISQANGDNNKVYGQGLEGFAHRYGIQYADQTLGNYFPESIVPTLFHEDPRYFRMGEGRARSRLLYAVSRMVIGKADDGDWTFNKPEILGNLMAASLASTYHPHQRTAGDIISEAGNFWESDVVGNIIKEFWPDVKRHFKHRGNYAVLALQPVAGL